MNTKPVITTLEEDFRAIGILPQKPVEEAKKDPEKKDPEKDEPPKKEPGKDDPKKDDPKGESTDPPKDGENVDEARKILTRVDKSASAKRARRMAKIKRRKDSKGRTQAKRRAKIWRKKGRGKRWAAAYSKARTSPGVRKPGKRLHVMIGGERRKVTGRRHEGLDRVAGLVEEVKEIVTGLNEGNVKEAVRAFANVSIIAELLSRSFTYFAEKHDDNEYDESSELLSSLAEDAAEIAEGLKASVDESEAVDLSTLDETFEGMMETIMMALEDYAELEPELAEEDEGDKDPSPEVNKGEAKTA
jgi:hypothetical protein